MTLFCGFKRPSSNYKTVSLPFSRCFSQKVPRSWNGLNNDGVLVQFELGLKIKRIDSDLSPTASFGLFCKHLYIAVVKHCLLKIKQIYIFVSFFVFSLLSHSGLILVYFYSYSCLFILNLCSNFCLSLGFF